MKLKRNITICISIIVGIFVLAILAIHICNTVVISKAEGRIFDNAEDIPAHEYGILLGTSPIAPDGSRNFNFDNRIKATVELFKAEKIKQVIASGGNYTYDDNGKPRMFGCNELDSMYDSLIKYGVPHNAITLDYDGTTTLNSIVKAKQFYGIDSCIIISQASHNERTIYQADHYGLKAVGYNAEPWTERGERIKDSVHELLARVKLFYDLSKDSIPRFDGYAITLPNLQKQEWEDEPEKNPLLKGSKSHTSFDESNIGFVKYFSTMKGKPFYYNSRHGFFVELPKEMGYNQRGENMMGAHDNEFYNADSSLVVSVYGMFYDAILYDYPNYSDTLKSYKRKYLQTLGKSKIRELSTDVWLIAGEIDHSNPENPPADRFLCKWLLRKDHNDRECEMSLTIYFNDSLTYRLPEFEKIIDQFPDSPAYLSDN